MIIWQISKWSYKPGNLSYGWPCKAGATVEIKTCWVHEISLGNSIIGLELHISKASHIQRVKLSKNLPENLKIPVKMGETLH